MRYTYNLPKRDTIYDPKKALKPETKNRMRELQGFRDIQKFGYNTLDINKVYKVYFFGTEKETQMEYDNILNFLYKHYPNLIISEIEVKKVIHLTSHMAFYRMYFYVAK